MPDTQTLLMVFIGIAALAMLLQAFILLAILVVVRRAARSVDEKVENLRATLLPILNTTSTVLQRLTPRVETAIDDITALVHSIRQQTTQAQGSIAEGLESLKAQAQRLDSMLTRLLNNVDRAGHFVNETVGRPVRQFSAIFASAKAIIDSLRGSARPGAHHTEAE